MRWSRRRRNDRARRGSTPTLSRPTSTHLVPNRETLYGVGMTLAALTLRQAVAVLTTSESEIRALGVSRLALFGSVLRNLARTDSDVDLLVQFAPGAKTYDRFLALSELLELRLGRSVELITTEALSPFIGPRILAEAQDVLRAAWLSAAHRRRSGLPPRTQRLADLRHLYAGRDAPSCFCIRLGGHWRGLQKGGAGRTISE